MLADASCTYAWNQHLHTTIFLRTRPSVVIQSLDKLVYYHVREYNAANLFPQTVGIYEIVDHGSEIRKGS